MNQLTALNYRPSVFSSLCTRFATFSLYPFSASLPPRDLLATRPARTSSPSLTTAVHMHEPAAIFVFSCSILNISLFCYLKRFYLDLYLFINTSFFDFLFTINTKILIINTNYFSINNNYPSWIRVIDKMLRDKEIFLHMYSKN